MLHTQLKWVERSEDIVAHGNLFIELVDASTLEDGMIGYARTLDAHEAEDFIGGLRRIAAAGTGHVLLAEDAEGPCGMVIMETTLSHNAKHNAVLKRAFIAPRARGGALLRCALVRVVEKCCELGVERLSLDTREGSKAYAMWSHFGFDTWGVMPDYSRHGGISHAGCYMSQPVASLARRVMINDKENTHV